MLTQVGVKQLTDFLRTVTAASDLVDCTLVNCARGLHIILPFIRQAVLDKKMFKNNGKIHVYNPEAVVDNTCGQFFFP